MAKTSGISQDKILEVAEAILSYKGAKETTLKDIAKAVGISKGTLYYHYATKEALLADLISRHFDQVVTRLMKMAGRKRPSMSREDLLALMLEDLGEQKQLNRLHLTLLKEMLAGDEATRAGYVGQYRAWEASVRKVLHALFGEENPVTDTAAGLLLTFMEGHAVRGAMLEEPGAYREVAGFIASLYGNGGDGDVG